MNIEIIKMAMGIFGVLIFGFMFLNTLRDNGGIKIKNKRREFHKIKENNSPIKTRIRYGNKEHENYTELISEETELLEESNEIKLFSKEINKLNEETRVDEFFEEKIDVLSKYRKMEFLEEGKGTELLDTISEEHTELLDSEFER